MDAGLRLKFLNYFPVCCFQVKLQQKEIIKTLMQAYFSSISQYCFVCVVENIYIQTNAANKSDFFLSFSLVYFKKLSSYINFLF